MKVIVFGATGFISQPIAQAFVRAGHIVYGTTRSASSAKQLEADEVIPIVCDAGTAEGREVWGKVATDVDIVIYAIPTVGPDAPVAALKLVESISAKRPIGAKITFIYNGGSWTQSRGPGGIDKWTSESQPHSGQVELTKWRWAAEEPVLSSKEVHGIVIRPSLLYGRSGSLYVDWLFKPAYEAAKKGGPIQTCGYTDGRLANIHTDDLADLYVKVAERGPLLGGQTFIGSNQASESFIDILNALERVSGAKGHEIRKPESLFEKGLTSTGLYKPSLGYAIVGWVPRKMSLVDGMDLYYKAWLASAKLE